MSGLPPLPGDPAGVRVVATRLAATAARLGALAGVLARLRDGATWDGPAGDAFGARLGEAPPVLDAVASRLGGAVGPLRSLADAMEEAQAVVAAAIREHADAEHAYAALEDRAAALVGRGLGEEDAELLVVRHLQREQVELGADARARHAAAAERFRDADARCAGTLRSLTLDAVADSGSYRLLSGASRAGHDLATVGVAAAVLPPLRPLAAAGDVLGVAGDAALLLAYGEGDWGELGTSAALTATGGVGALLRRGGAAGAERLADGAVSTRRLTSSQRLALGAAAEVRARRDAVRAALDVPPPRGTPSALLGGPPVVGATRVGGATAQAPLVRDVARALSARGRAAAGARLDRAFRDDWRLATANGPAAQRMYAGGASLQVGSAVVTRGVRPSRTDE